MGTVAQRVVTFYSFKGGVGRSFALCDVAVFLAKWGYEVLCVDFDLEAPGLHNYFSPWLSSDPRPGMIEILEAWGAKEPDEEISKQAIQPVNVPGTDNRLSLVTAGGVGPQKYARRLHAIEWAKLFDEEHQAGRHLEALRERWLERFDIVLVDSRTGWSDIGQICTIHLPDILVVLFTPNKQSLDGAIDVADASTSAIGQLPIDRAPLRVVPVLTRVDKDEFAYQQEWTKTLLTTAARFVEDWDPQEDTPPGVLAELVVPYVPYWAYGERIAALTTELVPALSVGRVHESLAAIIARGLSETALLMKFRDSYVEGARVGVSSTTTLSDSAEYDAYISYPRAQSELAVNLAQALRKRGIRTFIDKLALQPGDLWQDVLSEAQKRSQTFIILIDGIPTGNHSNEINAIVTRPAGQARIIPVVLTTWNYLPNALSPYQGISAVQDPDEPNVNKIADELYPAILRR